MIFKRYKKILNEMVFLGYDLYDKIMITKI